MGPVESPDSPPYILITATGAWILITLISGRCAQLSVRCSRQLTDTQSIRNGRLKWQVRGSYTGRCGRCGWCVVYTDRLTSTHWLPINSSHSQVVTRLTRHQSTRHIRVSSRSQLVTSEHATKPSAAAGEVVPRNRSCYLTPPESFSTWTVCRQEDMHDGVTENK